MAAPKLDIFETLKAIDGHNFDYLSQKSEEERKGFTPLVVMRWAASTTDRKLSDYQIVAINERVNNHFWELSDHPELQFKLMASCGTGRVLSHKWIGMAKSGKKTDALTLFLEDVWPDANELEIQIILDQFDIDSLTGFLISCGLDDKEEKAILNAYNIYRRKQGHL